MAKKKISFSEIGGIINGMTKKIPIQIANIEEDRNIEMLDTGIYILNAALCGDLKGGILSNRITTFAGDSGVGKSFLCYNLVKSNQEKGWNTIYIDTEQSINLEQLPNYGIDVNPDKFTLIRTNIIEDIKKFLTQLLDTLKEEKEKGNDFDKTMIILDSVGMLGSRKEVEDALNNKEAADMTRAKTLASLFRIIS